ncbi:cold shock domain-containing protein [Pseudomonas putida]|jgi:CspA family cold shock protein|uniref:Cold shock domain-containing protein n=2 Tax=Pseudomonas putida group TaxID=136845 RepID=A0A2N1ISA7_9PSED|nr:MULTISPECIES: cold shock domain-containing protein [Pseudomonas]EKT4455581.1 cold shock domain-containing protein [Pseudomonas putida]EKT4471026.1 cold shock domain-containing protein [Pseudomonas putida]EKT4495486.1 cold shock domain-containing protein [Pseudomonas putida]EKT4512915.1 cold shock domain-containing protein [Pseudomonas putida]EKT4531861.1 cold shock domain-containing protein [Pseudomonas putida]
MFKIVHLVTGVAALLLSLIPSLKTDATPFLQQPDAVYLALLGLLNLVLAPVVPLYHRGARQQLQHLACALLVVAVVLQTLTLLARPEMGNLAALVCAALAVALHLAVGFARGPRKARSSQHAAQDAGNRDTGTVKWFNTSKGFGFISRDSGDDIFVHFRAIRGEGHRILVEGQRVEFSVMHRDKGLQAEDVVAVTRR